VGSTLSLRPALLEVVHLAELHFLPSLEAESHLARVVLRQLPVGVEYMIVRARTVRLRHLHRRVDLEDPAVELELERDGELALRLPAAGVGDAVHLLHELLERFGGFLVESAVAEPDETLANVNGGQSAMSRSSWKGSSLSRPAISSIGRAGMPYPASAPCSSIARFASSTAMGDTGAFSSRRTLA
jgi:hypothetical protein